LQLPTIDGKLDGASLGSIVGKLSGTLLGSVEGSDDGTLLGSIDGKLEEAEGDSGWRNKRIPSASL
jgi:uncharacterized protein YcfJ